MTKANPQALGCGNCGYAVRGVTTTHCRECGADLTEVGITSTGKGGSLALAILLPFFFTVAVPPLAILLMVGLSQVIPTHTHRTASVSLNTMSPHYSEVNIETDLNIVIPAGTSGSGFTTNDNFGPPPSVDITFAPAGSTVHVNELAIEVMPGGVSGSTVTYAPPMRIDPKTRVATWVDANGKATSSAGAFKAQDILTYFADSGVNTTHADVQDNAQKLYDGLDDLLNGASQVTFVGYDSSGYGAGASSSIGPFWLLPAYAIGWMLFWVVGLIWIIRRVVRRSR